MGNQKIRSHYVAGFLVVLCLYSCNNATRFYFIRHAEKSAYPVQDPVLSEAGQMRAERLAELLRQKDIKKIFVTQTQRSKQTAEPLSRITGIDVHEYSSDTLPKFLYRLLDEQQNALVVGHSNTVLKMLEDLGLDAGRKSIADDEYDRIWIVSQKEKEARGGYQLQLRERRYGSKK